MFNNFFIQEKFNFLRFTLIKIDLNSRTNVVFLYIRNVEQTCDDCHNNSTKVRTKE